MVTPSSSSPKPVHQRQGSLQVLIASDKAINEKASFELGVVRKERTKRKRRYVPKDNILVYSCNFCEMMFPAFEGLVDHLIKHHQPELKLERQNGTGPCPEWPKPYDRYQYKFNHFVCKTSPKYKYETSLDSSNLNGPGGNNGSTANPSSNGGGTDMSMAVTPYRSLTSHASSSKGPLTSYNYNMNDNHVGLSSDPFESTGSGSTSRTNPRFNGQVHGIQKPYLIDNLRYTSASRVGTDLEFSLGPSKSIGVNTNVLNDGVIRGTTSMNMPCRPSVSRFHYAKGNPLDSINIFSDLSSLKENVSGSSHSEKLMSKGKSIIIDDDDDEDILMTEDDDDKDIWVFDDDDDDKDACMNEDDDAKSWGLDLSLSL